MIVHCRYTVDLPIHLPDDSDPQTAAQVAALIPAGPMRDALVAFHQAAKTVKAYGENLSPYEPMRVVWHVCRGHVPGQVGTCGPDHEVT